MTKQHRIHCRRAGLALALPLCLTSTPAMAAPKAVLTYFLPKTAVTATVSQQLLACTSPDEIVVETGWELKAVSRPDYSKRIRVDASTGFLAKRAVALKLNPDGTISAFNSESVGQGGAVIASALKFVGMMAPMFAGAAPMASPAFEMDGGPRQVPNLSPCTGVTQVLLDRRRAAEGTIASLEALIAADEATPAHLKLLTAKQEELAGLKAKLTIFGREPAKFEPATSSGSIAVARLDYTPWFGTREAPVKLPGKDNGFCVQWGASKAAMGALAQGNTTLPANPEQPIKRMVYRFPVPAAAVAGPAKTVSLMGCELDDSPEASAASQGLSFPAPQLSGLYSVPVGSAGIFGSREVKASFDGFGAPLEISYGSDPGAAAIAGTIDAAGGTVTAFRNAELEALNREIALREARKKLADLSD